MTAPAIRAERIGKQYALGRLKRNDTLRDVLMASLTAPWRSRRGRGPDLPARERTLWALRDVSFEARPGEILGVIGRNGAGKSTLLKILSRITEPTEGRAEVRGRVGSLLEVGTGFHPELTGRDNIFLNGAILGMARAEIKRKFDAIVAFAEVERFLDTPVKHYSSGMFVRLAFAVAAHLEPEILIVDEVLAVGDASFQRKCLNVMEEVGSGGRTVVFVSHNMPAVTRLCPRAILLDQGRVVGDGPAHEVVTRYLHSSAGTTAAREWTLESAPGNEVVRLLAVRVKGEDGQVRAALDIRQQVAVEIEFQVLEPGHVLVPNYHFWNDEGVLLFISPENDPAWHRRPRRRGRYVSTAWIPGNFLAEGTLLVGVAVSTLNPVVIHFFERNAVAFQVVDSIDGATVRGDYAGPMPGVVRPLLSWTSRCTDPAAE